jgi:SusD family
VRRLREAFGDEADTRVEMAQVLVWGGFTLHYLADNFCSATFNGGPEVSTDEVRRMAESDFTAAIAAATAAGSEPWRLRALAGRARARLFLGDAEGAIADARLIPDGFTFYFDYSTNSGRENNEYPGHTRDKYRREVGIHPRYFENATFRADPRMPMKDWGPSAVGPDAIRRWVEQEKYPETDTDMLVSSWQEVRLIEAEAEIRMGGLSRAVELINEVRDAVDLPPYSGALTEAAVTAQLRYERTAELWLQGQVLFDLRRFNDPILDVPPGRGGGSTRDRCWEIGEREYQTNPNLRG